MSRNNSRKELNGVYRRCLCALSQSFKMHTPTMEMCKRLEAKVAKEAKDMTFSSAKEAEAWAKERFEKLFLIERSRLATDPRSSLKAQIRAKIR